MSQVRKLLQGNKIPKAQEGYKFVLDDEDIYFNDDDLKELSNRIANYDIKHSRFVSNAPSAIKTGTQTGNRAANVMTMDMFSNLSKADLERLRKQKGSTMETLLQKDSYFAKEAAHMLLNDIYDIASKKRSNTPKKTAVEKSTINLDFNKKDGKKYLSPTSEQNINARKRVSDLFAHLQAGDTSTYDYSAYNTDAISSWLNGLDGDDKYKAGNDYFDNLWTAMGDPNYVYDPDDDDLLKMFGINYGLVAPVSNADNNGDANIVTDSIDSGDSGEAFTGNIKVGDIITVLDKDYRVIGFKEDGDPMLEEITNVEETSEANENNDLSQPSEVQQLVLIKPGDRNDMDWGVYYNGTPYSYESIRPGSELGNLMAKFEQNNRQLWNQGRRYNENSFIKMPSIENFADWTVGQTLDDGTDLNQFFLNQGVTSAALSHIITDTDGNRYYKYYNNFDPYGTYVPSGGNTPKENPWGIRSPYYLVIDKNGNISSVSELPHTEDETLVNRAPKFKDLWKPTDVANLLTPYINTYKTSSTPTYNGTVPATFIGTVKINSKTRKLYKLKDGRFYLQDSKNHERNAFLSPELLYRMFRKGKYVLKKGGTISKSKTNSFKSKFNNVVKVKDGVSELKLKYPHQITKRTVTNPDGSVIGIVEEQNNNGDIKTNYVLLQTPTKQQEESQLIVGNQPSLVNSQETTQGQVQEVIHEPTQEALPVSEESQTVDNTTFVSPRLIQRTNESSKLLVPTTNSEYEFAEMPHVRNSRLIIPQFEPTKQKVIAVKTNKKRDFDDLVSVLEQLTGKYESGGVLKGQGGIAPFEWKKQEEQNPYLPKSPEFEPIKSEWTKYNDIGGGANKNLKDYSKLLLPALSLARFGINSHFQNKYYRQSLEALEAGRVHDLPVTLNTPDTNAPDLDRAIRQNAMDRMVGIKPYTANWTDYNAAVNQREKQYWDREHMLIGQRSQYTHDINNEVLNIMNQNFANRINTINQNAARDAAINAAKKQAAMELTSRRAQSWENLGLEMQNNLYKDRQTMLNYNKALEAQRINKAYDTELDKLFPGARAAYLQLTPEQAAQYYEFEDYLRRNYPDKYNQNVDNIVQLQENRTNAMNSWMYNNGLNYEYPWWITGKTSPVGYKKGGRVNGTTRYKLEPDEQIWVDNNKAAHAAIAKLSESTIKLLLRALK